MVPKQTVIARAINQNRWKSKKRGTGEHFHTTDGLLAALHERCRRQVSGDQGAAAFKLSQISARPQ